MARGINKVIIVYEDQLQGISRRRNKDGTWS